MMTKSAAVDDSVLASKRRLHRVISDDEANLAGSRNTMGTGVFMK